MTSTPCCATTGGAPLRRGGARVLRVAQRADARAELATWWTPHRVLPGFDGHCYMYRAVKRMLERQAARVLYRGKARQTRRRPRVEAL